ncbi:hypothetical protein [Agromyces bauzanensis]
MPHPHRLGAKQRLRGTRRLERRRASDAGRAPGAFTDSVRRQDIDHRIASFPPGLVPIGRDAIGAEADADETGCHVVEHGRARSEINDRITVIRRPRGNCAAFQAVQHHHEASNETPSLGNFPGELEQPMP